jgi:hypothetical protein
MRAANGNVNLLDVQHVVDGKELGKLNLYAQVI